VLKRDHDRFWKFARLVFRAGNAAWDANRAHDGAIGNVIEARAAWLRVMHTAKRRDRLRAAFEREFPDKVRLIFRKD
jgi:hypothetical protein